jgi:hypothetical protein
MSARGDWIDFAELCRRVPEKSARTLRRMTAERQISSRQRCARGKLEFNWNTVRGELAALEDPGSGRSTEPVEIASIGALTAEIRALSAKLDALLARKEAVA